MKKILVVILMSAVSCFAKLYKTATVIIRNDGGPEAVSFQASPGNQVYLTMSCTIDTSSCFSQVPKDQYGDQFQLTIPCAWNGTETTCGYQATVSQEGLATFVGSTYELGVVKYDGTAYILQNK